MVDLAPVVIDEPKRAFVWPPQQASPQADSSVTESPHRSRPWPRHTPNKVVEALTQLESFWLAPTALPLARRIERTGWRPDTPGRYCDRCGMTIGPFETDEFGCAHCLGRSLPWRRFIRLGEYDGVLARWIIDAKFHRQRRLADQLGRRLGDAALAAEIQTSRLAVVPVAMAWTRRFVRPYNQTREIAQGVARRLRVPLVDACRRKPRPSQRSVPASRRRSNVHGSFKPRSGVDFTGWTVLLVDDVCTSGSTLTEAALTLKKQGARDLWAAAIAVTPQRNRRPRQP